MIVNLLKAELRWRGWNSHVHPNHFSVHESLWAQGTRGSHQGRNVCVCFFLLNLLVEEFGGHFYPSDVSRAVCSF